MVSEMNRNRLRERRPVSERGYLLNIYELKERRRRYKWRVRCAAAAVLSGTLIAVCTGVSLRHNAAVRARAQAVSRANTTDQGNTVSISSGAVTPRIADLTESAGIVELVAPGQVFSGSSDAENAEPMATGWQKDANGIYNLNDSGVRRTGFFTDTDGSTYYFDGNGYLIHGWLTLENATYYFDSDGRMATGQKTIDKKNYYFSDRGVMDPSKTTVVADKMICLTFDDGPGAYTDKILDLLTQYNAKATFFMIGEQVSDHAAAVKREHELGMEQGNHTWDHTTLTHLSADEIRTEFSKTNDIIEQVTGQKPTLYRPPGGGYNDEVFDNDFDMPCILWSIDTLDWKTKDADNTYKTVMENAADGAIILMHEIYEPSYEAAKRIIPDLEKQGYQFVTISEMAAAKGDKLRPNHPYGSF